MTKSFSLKAALAAAAFLATTAVALASPAIVTEKSKLRDEPTRWGTVIDTLWAGEVVEVYGCTNAWCYVGSDDASGFVKASKLSYAVYPTHKHHYEMFDDVPDLSFSIGGWNTRSMGFSFDFSQF